MLVAQQMFQQTQSFPMLALPFFMLAGTLMMGGKLGEELLHFATEADAALARRPLSTTVVGSVVFGGVSGSAVANASALGSVLIPWQKAAGLSGRALRGQQRHLGGHRHPDPAVDPDDPLRARQRRQHRRPVHRRHSARAPDGGWASSACCWWRGGAAQFSSPDRQPSTCALAAAGGAEPRPALMLPILILLGLRFGFATPTEIAVLAVVYALAASAFSTAT